MMPLGLALQRFLSPRTNTQSASYSTKFGLGCGWWRYFHGAKVLGSLPCTVHPQQFRGAARLALQHYDLHLSSFLSSIILYFAPNSIMLNRITLNCKTTIKHIKLLIETLKNYKIIKFKVSN